MSMQADAMDEWGDLACETADAASEAGGGIDAGWGELVGGDAEHEHQHADIDGAGDVGMADGREDGSEAAGVADDADVNPEGPPVKPRVALRARWRLISDCSQPQGAEQQQQQRRTPAEGDVVDDMGNVGADGRVCAQGGGVGVASVGPGAPADGGHRRGSIGADIVVALGDVRVQPGLRAGTVHHDPRLDMALIDAVPIAGDCKDADEMCDGTSCANIESMLDPWRPNVCNPSIDVANLGVDRQIAERSIAICSLGACVASG